MRAMMWLAHALFLGSSAASPASGDIHLTEMLARRRKHVARTLKAWRIRHRAQPKVRFAALGKAGGRSAADDRGYKFTLLRPTKERVARWFGEDAGPNEVPFAGLRGQFNHDFVGMTNPLLHHQSNGSDDALSVAVPISTTMAAPTVEPEQRRQDAWWPSIVRPGERRKWRTLTYRGCVGRGAECYRRVRDAVLDWEFQNGDGSTGIMNVPARARSATPASPRGYTSYPDDWGKDDAPFHRTIGSARKMVSFASSRLLPLLPAFYALNPVMVVYDLVDQRGPGTTFSSTAYATMRGHLLRGEERVTVALRDSDQSVDVEVVSISRPATTAFARGLWPFIGRKQDNFFRMQMEFLKGIGSERARGEEETGPRRSPMPFDPRESSVFEGLGE